MDVHQVVQHIQKGEEVAHVEEEVLLIELVSRVWELAFSGACVHSRRGHNNFNILLQGHFVIVSGYDHSNVGVSDIE